MASMLAFIEKMDPKKGRLIGNRMNDPFEIITYKLGVSQKDGPNNGRLRYVWSTVLS